ncbi:hypothetical protein N335_01943, partial [Phaethon lepturus]
TTVIMPVGTIIGSSVIWDDIIYCKNIHFLARKFFNHVLVCLEA